MITRNRRKQVIIPNVKIRTIFFSGIVQVGDVYGDCHPTVYSEVYTTVRGAPSFITAERLESQNTRLHFVNQIDEDVLDYNIFGERILTFRPNIRGDQFS
jgi:hypothetical protein